MTVDGFGQRKFLSGEQPAGIMHALVFWGFVVLMLQVITLFGRAFDVNWNIPGFGPDQLLGPPFFILRDLLEVTVIVGAGYMLYRRVIVHPSRLVGIAPAEQRFRDADHREAILILVFIELIMIGGLLYDAAHLVAFNIHGNERDFAPRDGARRGVVRGPQSLDRADGQRGRVVRPLSRSILIFLNLLPLSKHFHIITAIPNVFLSKSSRRPRLERPLAVTQVPPRPPSPHSSSRRGRAFGVTSLPI